MRPLNSSHWLISFSSTGATLTLGGGGAPVSAALLPQPANTTARTAPVNTVRKGKRNGVAFGVMGKSLGWEGETADRPGGQPTVRSAGDG